MQEDRGENPRVLNVCLTALRTQQKSKSRCGSSEAKCRVKITSRFRDGGLRLVRLVFNLTQFTLHLSCTIWTCSDLTGCWRDCSLRSIDMILLPTAPCALRGCLDTGMIIYQTLETFQHYYKSWQLGLLKITTDSYHKSRQLGSLRQSN